MHFKRHTDREDPKVLLVAPLSGHFATLLRGTVEALLPDHDVFVTDWQDCRMVPITEDKFNLNDYIDYLIDFLHVLGPNTHVIAVCQPAVPAMAATAVMSGWNDACVPATLTLIGGPIDTRKSPTAVNTLAQSKPLEWFEQHVVVQVPPPYPGMFRKVYPGFIQLTNFVAMNFEKHLASYHELFDHLVEGDDEAADKKRGFYEEYQAVMDLPAEFYLDTLKVVFQDHALPKGEMVARWHPVLPEKITRTAILCIEGELDDISGVGQTKAALEITTNLPDYLKRYHLQKGVGHYGVFNGRKWRTEIAPVIKEFIREHDHESGHEPVPASGQHQGIPARPAARSAAEARAVNPAPPPPCCAACLPHAVAGDRVDVRAGDPDIVQVAVAEAPVRRGCADSLPFLVAGRDVAQVHDPYSQRLRLPGPRGLACFRPSDRPGSGQTNAIPQASLSGNAGSHVPLLRRRPPDLNARENQLFK